MERYQRQILLPQIQQAGQEKLSQACALLIGVGALGCTIADQLARAGVGRIVLVDRDIVELTNLHRQTLYDETDARLARPKAYAASLRLIEVNKRIEIQHVVTDVTADNIRDLVYVYRPTLLLDGTDNAETRYLVNDASIRDAVPWIYGACVGTEGRVMTIVPGVTPCLRCVFPTMPSPGELATCDTAGVLGAASATVGALQAVEAIKLIVEGVQSVKSEMTVLDVWSRRYRVLDLTDARRADCLSCVKKQLNMLVAQPAAAASLCGRNTVQVRLANLPRIQYTDTHQPLLDQLTPRLEAVLRDVQRTPYLVRARVDDATELSVFADGRVLVHGTSDLAKARTIVARYLG